MKKISIFSLPGHESENRTSAVDYLRVNQPMKYLNGYKDEEVEFEVNIWDKVKEKKAAEDKSFNWDMIGRDYDIIYFNYIANAWNFAKMGMFARKYNKKIVMDMDDALWDILPDNTVYDTYKKG